MTQTWSLAKTLSGEFFSELFRSNVLLSARGRRHTAAGFKGPLSIKGVVRGEGLWTVGGEQYRVDATSCLVIGRDEPYDLLIDSTEEVETFVVFFSDPLASDVADASTRSIDQLLESPHPPSPSLPSLPSLSSPPSLRGRLWTAREPIHQALHVLRECATDPMEQGEVDRHLRRALDSMIDATGAVEAERARIAAARNTTREELHRRVLLGKAHLDAALEEPFDLGATARAACLSPHHFHRSFHSVMQCTPFTYVTERRIARAQRYLVERDWDVVDISTALGYQSLPSFTRLFKRATGLTPAAYRTQRREQLRNDG
jgi:AraC family transcriptional regulator